MGNITPIRWSEKEWSQLTEILTEEKVINRSDFFKTRILHRRRMQPLEVTDNTILIAQVANMINGVIDDYRNNRDIIEDLKEIQTKLKSIV